MPNASGELISLGLCLQTGPVILKFYRGEWCSYCNIDLKEIQKYLPQIEELGASLLAVSPQNSENAFTMKENNVLGFVVLSDAHQEVIKAYHLQFDPGKDYHRRRDLSILNGGGSILLPVPATFIIKPDFRTASANVDANYTMKMSPIQMLEVLKI